MSSLDQERHPRPLTIFFKHHLFQIGRAQNIRAHLILPQPLTPACYENVKQTLGLIQKTAAYKRLYFERAVELVKTI